jgi:hypothetical protein
MEEDWPETRASFARLGRAWRGLIEAVGENLEVRRRHRKTVALFRREYRKDPLLPYCGTILVPNSDFTALVPLSSSKDKEG